MVDVQNEKSTKSTGEVQLDRVASSVVEHVNELLPRHVIAALPATNRFGTLRANHVTAVIPLCMYYTSPPPLHYQCYNRNANLLSYATCCTSTLLIVNLIQLVYKEN